MCQVTRLEPKANRVEIALVEAALSDEIVQRVYGAELQVLPFVIRRLLRCCVCIVFFMTRCGIHLQKRGGFLIWNRGSADQIKYNSRQSGGSKVWNPNPGTGLETPGPGDWGFYRQRL